MDEKGFENITLKTLIMLLTYLKELALNAETEVDTDEYLDAFVAMGGSYNREGYVSKESLI